MESYNNEPGTSSEHGRGNNNRRSYRRQGLEGESRESSAKSDEISMWLEKVLDSDQEQSGEGGSKPRTRSNSNNGEIPAGESDSEILTGENHGEIPTGESDDEIPTGESILVLADRVLGEIHDIDVGKTQGQEDVPPDSISGASSTSHTDQENDDVNTLYEDISDPLPDETIGNNNDNDDVSYQPGNNDGESDSDERIPKTQLEESSENKDWDQTTNNDESDNYVTETTPEDDDDQSHLQIATPDDGAFEDDVTETTPAEPTTYNEEDSCNDGSATSEEVGSDEDVTDTTTVEPFNQDDRDLSRRGIGTRKEDTAEENVDGTTIVEPHENDDGCPKESTPTYPSEASDETHQHDISSKGEEEASGEDINDDVIRTMPVDPFETDEGDQSNDRSVIDKENASEEDVPEATPVEPSENDDESISRERRSADEGDVSDKDVTETLPVNPSEDNDDETSATGEKIMPGENNTNDVAETRQVEPSENNEEDLPSNTDDEGESDEQHSENNEQDFSNMGIASNVSDMEEIDLHSDSEEEDGNNATSRSQPGSREGLPADVEAGENGENMGHGATYFGTYVDILHCLGISMRRGDGSSSLGMWNYIPFFLIATIAIVHMLMLQKNNIMFSEDDKDILIYYIEIGYDMNTFLLRVSFFCLILFKTPAIVDSIKALRIVAKTSTESKKVCLTVGLLVFLTTAAAISYTLLRIVSRLDESNSDLILYSSYDLAETIFLWTKRNLDNETDILDQLYGTTRTPTTVTMGLSNILITITGYTYEFIAKDASLVVCFDMYLVCSDFVALLESTDAKRMTPEVAAQLWTRYKQIRNASEKINDCMEYIFLILHLDNTMFLTYFFYDHLFLRQNFLLTPPEIYALFKIFSFYGLALMASLINTKFHAWIQSSFRGQNTPFIDDGEPVQTNNLLHELETDPIGIGKGMFFIGGPFLTKFATVVGSCFMFIRETSAT